MTKETKRKTPFSLRMIQWFFPKLERVAPSLAEKWAWKLFFTPFRFPVPAKELDIVKEANKFTFESEGYTIQVYEWGKGDDTILLMHGWSGRATQWREFIKPLNENGYKVVAIDGPSHGNSSGKMTDIMKFKNILKKVQEIYPEINTVITHSFGGAAIMFGIQNDLKIKRLVNIGTPTDGDYIISDFLRKINASPKSGDRFKKNIIDNFGHPFSFFTVKETIKSANNTALLMIHDRLDKEVPVQHSIDLHEAIPGTQLVMTEGLGHIRILRDKEVIAQAIGFVKNEIIVS